MATLTQKQVRLISGLATEYVTNYDRVVENYLDLRRDIFGVYLARQRGDTVDDDRVDTLRQRLELSRREFTAHIQGLISLIEYHEHLKESEENGLNPDLVGYQQQIKNQHQAIENQQKEVERQITEINEVHKPLLDKLQTYVTYFDPKQKRQLPKWIGERLKLTREDVLLLFDEEPRIQQLAGELLDWSELKDSRGAAISYDQILRKELKSNTYDYDTRKHAKAANINDISEAAIAEAEREILRLDDETAAQRDLWKANAHRLLQLEGALQNNN